jgi:hypothetical protein
MTGKTGLLFVVSNGNGKVTGGPLKFFAGGVSELQRGRRRSPT